MPSHLCQSATLASKDRAHMSVLLCAAKVMIQAAALAPQRDRLRPLSFSARLGRTQWWTLRTFKSKAGVADGTGRRQSSSNGGGRDIERTEMHASGNAHAGDGTILDLASIGILRLLTAMGTTPKQRSLALKHC